MQCSCASRSTMYLSRRFLSGCGKSAIELNQINNSSFKRKSAKICSMRKNARRSSSTLVETLEIENDIEVIRPAFKTMTFLEFDAEILETVELGSTLPPIHSTSFADYMNFSKTLQALAMFGVKLFRIEKSHPEALNYMVKLDLHTDIKPRLDFLQKCGVKNDQFASMLTRNPNILNPDVKFRQMEDNLRYLAEKKFTLEEITSLIVRNPLFLTIPLPKLDGILGFYQKLETNRSERKISFTNAELRTMINRSPGLLQRNLYAIYEQVRTLEVSFGFNLSQIRKIIISSPLILIKDAKQLELMYKFYTRVMNYTNEELVKFPTAFDTRIWILKDRHYYLKHLNRAYYKPEEPGYISIPDLIHGNDETFCERLKLGPVKNFHNFQKTL